MAKRPLSRESKEATALLSIGTFLEYFDLMLFVHMAVVLNDFFFPKDDPFITPLLTAFAFCSTYVFRPIGALLFGWIGDNIGRKSTIVITTTMMAISCIAMANMPTYAEIGVTAAILVTVCRIVQGMTSMGERIGAEIYLTESPLHRFRFPVVALIAAFSTVGGTAALGFAHGLMKYKFDWRIAFWIGGFVAIIGLISRLRLPESMEFVNFKKLQKRVLEEQFASPARINEVLDAPIFKQRASWWTRGAFFCIQCAHPLCFYFIYGYCVTILKDKFHCTPAEIIHNNFIVSLFELAKMLIIVPFLSYYIYPLRILGVKLALFSIGILVGPYFLSTATSANDVFIIQAICSLIALGSGPALPIFYSHLPVAERSTSASLIYAIARAFMYIITTFSCGYVVNKFGYNGLLILFIPVFTGYLLGLIHFTKLEKKSLIYPNSWFNLHILYPQNDDDDDDDDDDQAKEKSSL